MENSILGLHHITAIAADAQENYNFYTRVLGQRLVKRTVNFDDPKTYHFYFGDAQGTPGTILTFFPWQGISRGTPGVGMATEIGYTVPAGSLQFWTDRFKSLKVPHSSLLQRFGEQVLLFEDHDGLKLSLTEGSSLSSETLWETAGIDKTVALRSFHSVVLSLRSVQATSRVLTDILGYTHASTEGNRSRFSTAGAEASFIDLLEDPSKGRGQGAGGTVHHIAFRVKNEEVLMYYRNRIASMGLQITEKIDRDYFYSVYFREPGGVLFELATENPGFSKDEPAETLGQELRLPRQYEAMRTEIAAQLPPLVM